MCYNVQCCIGLTSVSFSPQHLSSNFSTCRAEYSCIPIMNWILLGSSRIEVSSVNTLILYRLALNTRHNKNVFWPHSHSPKHQSFLLSFYQTDAPSVAIFALLLSNWEVRFILAWMSFLCASSVPSIMLATSSMLACIHAHCVHVKNRVLISFSADSQGPYKQHRDIPPEPSLLPNKLRNAKFVVGSLQIDICYVQYTLQRIEISYLEVF